MNNQQHFFSDDAPKKNPWTEDRLGYRPFTQRLADVIVQINAPNGYVIGLHGSWGSGKSTAINFVKSFLNKYNEEDEDQYERLKIIDFKPWMGSGQIDLIPAFFKVLSENISDHAIKRRKWLERILKFGKVSADPLVDAAATMAIAADPSLGIGSKVAAGATKKSLSVAIDRWLEKPSLQVAYTDLCDRLKLKGDKFLVIIDDIDRLTQTEIRLMMQMVKTIGQLPNVIYLLAYDRSVVADALSESAYRLKARSEPSFAEKIVQHEVELPQPSRNSLLKILDDEIGFITAGLPENPRWVHIVYYGIFKWIKYPRDVARFGNAVKFTWPSLAGEIDAQDFICMEGLRLFDETLFNWIRTNRDFLLSEGQFAFGQDEEKAAIVEALKSRLSAEEIPSALELLVTLFPNFGKLFMGRDGWFSAEPNFEVVKRRGISTKQGFTAYFYLQLNTEEVSKRIVDEAISKLSDRSYQEKALRHYIDEVDSNGNSLIGNYLRELQYRFLGDQAAVPTIELLSAIMEFGDEICVLERGSGIFELPAHVEASYLIKRMLVCWGQSHAAEVLIKTFLSSPSLTMCADVFCDLARSLGKMPGTDRDYDVAVTEADLSKLSVVLLFRIREAAASGTLSDAPFFYDILRTWHFGSNSDEAKKWASINATDSSVFLAKLAIGMMSYSMNGRTRHYTLHERPDPNLYDLLSLKIATEKHRNAEELNQDFSSRIEAMRIGLDKFLARKE